MRTASIQIAGLALLLTARAGLAQAVPGGDEPPSNEGLEKIIVSMPNGEKIERWVPKSSPLFGGLGSGGSKTLAGDDEGGAGMSATPGGAAGSVAGFGSGRVQIPDDASEPLEDEWGGFTGNGSPEGEGGGVAPEGGGKKKFEFTSLAASSDTRIVYVSSSQGDDANSGLSPDEPVKTIEKGKSLLRDRQPDWLLFKRGDTWDTGLGIWKLSGRSEDERMVVGHYGDHGAQPLFKGGIWVSGGNGTPTKLSNLAFVGLDFYAAKRDPNSPEYQGPTSGGDGLVWIRSGENLLVEGCRFLYFKTGMMFQGEAGGMRNIDIRGCVVAHSYGVEGSFHSSGIYVANVQDLMIVESVFDHNGWNEQIPEAKPTIYNHNLYIDYGNTQGDTSNVKVIGCIISRGASHGLQLRPGGVARGNLFVQNAIAMFTAKSDSTILNNVVIDPRDITASQPRGWGLEVIGSPKTAIRGNIVAHKAPGVGDGVAIRVSKEASLPVASYKVLIENNLVYGWNGSSFATVTEAFDEVTVRNNCFQNLDYPTTCVWLWSKPDEGEIAFADNVYYSVKKASDWFMVGDTGQNFNINGWKNWSGDTSISKEMPFVDPDRNLATYHATLGKSADFEAFMGEAIRQSKVNWRNEYRSRVVNNYIRKGFDCDEP